MSDIFTPVGRALPGYSGPAVVSGVVNDPPRSFANLSSGTIVKGTVLGRGQDGLTAVATDKGTVKVATNAQLPQGSTVTLEVRNAGDRLQVLVLSVDTSSARQPTTPPASSSGGPTAVGTGAAGPSTGGSVAASGSGGTATPPSAKPPPPPIEFVGTSVPAIVVQNASAASLLPTPDPDVQPFIAPASPVTVPADAVQKAQLLAQTLQLIDPLLIGDADTTAAPVASPAAPPPLPNATATPIGIKATPATLGTLLAASALASDAAAPPVAANPAAPNASVVSPASSLALPPEVAQRITALFAAEATLAPAAAPLLPTAPALASIALTDASLKGTPLLNLPSGTEVTLHVIAVLPSQGGMLEIAPEAARLAANVAPVIGTVLGYTRGGQPVVQTPAGMLMIQQRTRLPVGAQIALAIEPTTPSSPAAAFPPVSTPQQALLQLSSSWPTLDDLITVLSAAAGTTGEMAPPPPPGVPQTGPKLAAGLVNAVAAFRSGEIEKLLGPLLAAARRPGESKDDLAKRLRQEFAQLSELAQDRPAVDWRALFLPIYDERAGLTQINLYYRRGGGSDDSEKERGTRFLVEVNFAVLGAFQLDGLMRGKRFDLMIRSRRRLSPGHRRDIQGIFEEALAIVGSAGGLEFRTVETFPVSPLDELRQSHDRLTA